MLLLLPAVQTVAAGGIRGFEQSSGYLREPAAPGADILELVHSEKLEQWPAHRGEGVIDWGFAPREERFSYLKREGARLMGVEGVTNVHPAFAELTIGTFAGWELNPTMAKARNSGTLSLEGARRSTAPTAPGSTAATAALSTWTGIAPATSPSRSDSSYASIVRLPTVFPKRSG